jgi:tetratricopeptide (TPR) repeat protein
MKRELKEKIKSFLPFIAIPAILVLAYSNSFTTGFQLDDNHTILNNPSIGYIGKFLDIERWLLPLYNRQIPYLTFTINFLMGGYNVVYYHLTNFLIHLINTFLVYWFVNLLFQSPVMFHNPLKNKQKTIALFTSLIFAVHPVQVQAVTYITQRMVSLAILFYLLSLCFYLKGRFIHPSNKKSKIGLFFLSIISFILGIFSKEIIYSLPLAIILIEFLLLRNESNKVSRIIYLYIAIVFAGIFWMIFIYGIPTQVDAPPIYNYFLTELRVLVTYLRLLFLPYNHHLFYYFPISNSLFELSVLLSLVLLIILLISGIYSIKKYPHLSFSIFWFFILLAIESSIIPLKFVINEYRLYAVVIGFGLALTSGLYLLFKEKPKLIQYSLGLVVILFSILTFNQNRYWQDGVTLWQQNIDAAPLNPVPHNNLGTYYYSQKEYDKAIAQFSKAIELDSNYADAYNHRGIVFRERNMFKTSLVDFDKAITINYKNPMYMNNKGYTFQGMGFIDSAIFYYKRAIKLSPDYHNALNNLSIAFQITNQLDSSLYYSNRAIKINPYNSRYFNNRGNIYYLMGDMQNAHLNFIRALEIEPQNAKALNNLATVLMKRNYFNEAIELLTDAIKIDPNYPDPLFNRGYCFLSLKKYELAGKDFYECLRLNPNHKGAIECIKYISSKY